MSVPFSPSAGDLVRSLKSALAYRRERKNPLVVRGDVDVRPSWAMVFRGPLPQALVDHFGSASNERLFGWVRDAGGVEVTSQLVRLRLRGNARSPVIVDAIDVDITRRVKVEWHTEVRYPTAGATSAEMLWVSLENDSDLAAKLMTLDGGAPTFHPESFAGSGRTFKLSNSDEETVLLFVKGASDRLVEHEVRVTYHVGDRQGFVTWPDHRKAGRLRLAAHSLPRTVAKVWCWGELEGSGPHFVPSDEDEIMAKLLG